mmetsp:Transcript_17689/g.49102  ORF Transcript_17689/g.49102 Transcript_17689/m.49102 type:complete len:92 (+) Transcript_17689:636-911(+)
MRRRLDDTHTEYSKRIVEEHQEIRSGNRMRIGSRSDHNRRECQSAARCCVFGQFKNAGTHITTSQKKPRPLHGRDSGLEAEPSEALHEGEP